MKFSRYAGVRSLFLPSALWLCLPASRTPVLQTLGSLAEPFFPCVSAKIFKAGGHLLSHAVSSAVSSAVRVLTVVFGMGTGVPHGRIAASCFSLFPPPIDTQTVEHPSTRIPLERR